MEAFNMMVTHEECRFRAESVGGQVGYFAEDDQGAQQFRSWALSTCDLQITVADELCQAWVVRGDEEVGIYVASPVNRLLQASEAEEMIKRFSCADPIRPITIEGFLYGARNLFEIRAICTASSRGAHGSIRLHQAETIPMEMLTAERLRNTVRKCIHNLLKHEADEWLTFDGVLVHDPHSGAEA